MEYVRDLKFDDVHVYKLAKILNDSGERSPSGSSDSSSGGSKEEGAGSSEESKLERKNFVDGNQRYLQSEKY